MAALAFRKPANLLRWEARESSHRWRSHSILFDQHERHGWAAHPFHLCLALVLWTAHQFCRGYLELRRRRCGPGPYRRIWDRLLDSLLFASVFRLFHHFDLQFFLLFHFLSVFQRRLLCGRWEWIENAEVLICTDIAVSLYFLWLYLQ